jgi:hypothetical protein
MGEHRRSVRRDVLAKAERARFAQERCKGRLPGLDWQAAQIVAVNLDQIEREEHRDVARTAPPQRLEIGEPVRPDGHGLAVHDETLGLEKRCSSDDGREAGVPE